jgi:glyoxylate reductase
MSYKILVTRRPPGDAVDRLAASNDVWEWPHNSVIDRDVLIARIADVDGLYCMLTDRIDAELLDAAPNLRVVSNMAVGVDNIDLAACEQRGIAVGNTPDVLTDSTADMAWALLMASSRRIEAAIKHVKDGEWGPWDPGGMLGLDISGTTLGIVGMGRIGAAVARRAAGFDMDILYTSRSVQNGVEDQTGALRVSLEDLLEHSDHVVICVALNDDTKHLIDAAALQRMKPTANLVNIARGPIVDTDALYDALATGQIRSAGLDVIDPEPIAADHPIVALPNCTVIPHLGSATERTRIAMADLAEANLVAGLSGEPMPSRVV